MPHSIASGANSRSSVPSTRLDIKKLEDLVQFYFQKGLASSTQRTYKNAQDRFLKFCCDGGFTPLPVTESVLCAYVSYLANQHLKHTTIKVYLSAIRHLQIAAGLTDPFASVAWPRLDQVIRGIKRVEAEKGTNKKERLPISPVILSKLKEAWSQEKDKYDTKMIWAACCLCFFAFLRAGEMTVPSDEEYDPSVHLSVQDIAVDNSQCPSILCIKIKQSKTDPFRKGVDLFVGKTGSSLCPVSAMLSYLCVRGMEKGPLFKFEDGRLLSRQRFVKEVRDGLQKAGIDSAKYSGHSFRIGAATTAAAKGIEDCIIKTLGRWESLAYLQYVKIPRSQLAGYSNMLAS